MEPPRVTRPAMCALALVLGIAVWSVPARADWPVPRGDVARTAALNSPGNLRDPQISWQHYLGGAITDQSASMHDLDDDGAAEIIFVSGGRLMAKERDDRPLWQTPIQGIRSIVGIADFDGDGGEEVAALSRARIFLVDIRSGVMRWISPAEDSNAIDAVRIGDLDGDGRADLLAATCPCCRVATEHAGFAYGFASGFSASPAEQRLWELPDTSCGGRYSMVLWDPNGDGRLDATFSDPRSIGVVDGTTGLSCLDGSTTTCQPDSPQYVNRLDLGRRANAAHCRPANLDARAGDELVCMQNNGPAEDPDASHRVFVLGYTGADSQLPARLEVRWQRVVGTRTRLIAMGAQPVADLDGDGQLELVVSGRLDDDRWVTEILDAATGSLLSQITDHRIVGALDLSGPVGPSASATYTLLTDRIDTLWAWSFRRQDSPRVRGRWSLPGLLAPIQPELALSATAYRPGQVSARDVTGDGRPELILIGRQRKTLFTYDTAGIVPRQIAEYSVDESSTILELWALSERDDESAALLVAVSNGVMYSLDAGLSRLSDGLRFGGYYPKGDWRNLGVTPVTGDLGAGVDSVIVTDARNALIRIDAQSSTVGDEGERPTPTVIWSLASGSSPIIIPGLVDGAPGIACRQIADDGSRHIRVLAADGQVARSHDINGDGDARLLSDLVPAQLDDDGVTDLVVQWGVPGDLDLHIQALDGASLASKWHVVPPFAGTSRFPAGGAIADWNEDGIDDYIHQYYRTQIISGADGSILTESDENGVYYMPIVTQLDDDPRPELVLQGGYSPVQAVDDDLSALWQSAEDTRPYPYGALARCGGTTYLIEGSLAEPSALHRTRVDADAAADGRPEVSWTRILAHGQIYADIADARLDGDFLGQLTSTVVHSDLTGDGRPIALVGSEDGFLYAIDACAGTIEFALPFPGSVGAIAFGDTDGDGFDEILVAAADGYLYAIDSGDDNRRGFLVGCRCGSSAPTAGSWFLFASVCMVLVWRRRRRRSRTHLY